MTREEAIYELETMKTWSKDLSDDEIEALKFALHELNAREVITCKDCNEWHKGKYRDGSDVYSDEGYCSVHRIITGENYYCGDGERR